MSEEMISHEEPVFDAIAEDDCELEACEEETYEEITSDEVDSVIEVLDALLEKVQSENIRSYIEEAATNIHYLVYEDDDEDAADETGMSDPVTEAA